MRHRRTWQARCRRYVPQASSLLFLSSLIAPIVAWANAPDVLINPQGLAQQDISIRGSSYSGTGVSINGLNLKVPYSAHFNSELPALKGLFSEPAAKNGLDHISGNLVGTAAYTFLPLEIKSEASVELGTKEHYKASLFGSSETFGGFLDGEKAQRIDYDANDLDRLSGSAFVQLHQNDWQFDILAARQTKEFGAQGYYGIPSDIYADERTEDGLLFFSGTKGELDDAYLRAGASLREFDDQYRIPSSAFANDVLSRLGTAVVEGRTMEIQNIALSFRGDLEHERISGDLDSRDRTRGSIMLLPEARFERLVLKAGLNMVFQSVESAEWLPQAGIDWLATDNSTLYASYTETEDQPDYQSLYYSGPYRTGNPLLQQQHSQNAEVGFRQFLSATFDWRIAAFFRRMENASDWTQSAPSGIWAATDLGTLEAGGIDVAATFQASEELILKAYYQWVKKSDYDFYAGLYELDYPEHLLNFSAYWAFLDEFALDFSQTLRAQTPNNYRTSNNFGADASLGLHYFPRFAKNVRLSFRVDNLWGSNFQAIPGLKPRPTTASAGIAVGW